MLPLTKVNRARVSENIKKAVISILIYNLFFDPEKYSINIFFSLTKKRMKKPEKKRVFAFLQELDKVPLPDRSIKKINQNLVKKRKLNPLLVLKGVFAKNERGYRAYGKKISAFDRF